MEVSKMGHAVGNEPFWLVWSPYDSNPEKRHETEESATKEAAGLARNNPKRIFYVLKATHAAGSTVTTYLNELGDVHAYTAGDRY